MISCSSHSGHPGQWIRGVSLEAGDPLDGVWPGEEAAEEGSRWIGAVFGKHQTELAGRLASERGRGWSQGGPPDTGWMVSSLRSGAQYSGWERNTVSIQMLKRNHNLPYKVLIPVLLVTLKIEASKLSNNRGLMKHI